MKITEYISEITKPVGTIYLRFKERMGEVPPNASKEQKDKARYLTAYAGFANSPDELTREKARLRFGKLTTMQDIVKMIKDIMSDDVFISVKKMTVYMDLPESSYTRFPYLKNFLNWARENGKGRIDVEFKPGGEGGEGGPRKKRKPNPFKGQKIRDVDAADKRYTVTFTVGERFYREIERRMPNLMKYRGPNKTFVMPDELFMKFRKEAESRFPDHGIKIVKRVHTAEEGLASPSGPQYDMNGGSHRLSECPHCGGSCMDDITDESGPAKRSLCRSKKPDSALGASQLASCVSQGLRSHKSGRADYVGGKKLKVAGKKIKGKKYGGPLPDYS